MTMVISAPAGKEKGLPAVVEFMLVCTMVSKGVMRVPPLFTQSWYAGIAPTASRFPGLKLKADNETGPSPAAAPSGSNTIVPPKVKIGAASERGESASESARQSAIAADAFIRTFIVGLRFD